MSEEKPLIYIVEDEENIRELILYTLETTDFLACGFEDSQSFFLGLAKETPSLCILDIMLPGMNGLEILSTLKEDRRYKDIPIIMLTAKSSELDTIKGLDMGADDYISKPFSVLELVSRIHAVLRRSQTLEEENILKYKDLTLSKDKRIVKCANRKVELTFKEFELLEALLEESEFVFSRELLLEKIWGYDFSGETRTVDMHIKTLRQKLDTCGEYIKTVRGVGYKIGE